MILVTGANGFIGRALCRELAASGKEVVAATRGGKLDLPGVRRVRIPDLCDRGSWTSALEGVDALVHLAALVHVMPGDTTRSADSYERINVEGTRAIARAATGAGVRRMIYLSTVKVHGDRSGERPFRESDTPVPEDDYARSKLRGEQMLAEIAAHDGLEAVVLRPPLVYGPGVSANFLSLLRLCDSPLPLPFGAVNKNARSLIYLGNMISAIKLAIDHSAAAGNTYLVSDGAPVSSRALIGALRHILNRRRNLLPIPSGSMEVGARIMGKAHVTDRLFGSLAVDDTRIREELGWTPPFTFEHGLAATAAWYRASRAS